MVHVEVPGEVDGVDAADLARHQQFLENAVLRRVPVIERDDDLLLVARFRVEHCLALLLVDDHRLFGHHVHAAVERLHDVLAVLLHEKPSYFSFRRGNIEITLGGKLRGNSEFIDDRTSGNVQLATAVKNNELANFLYSRLA